LPDSDIQKGDIIFITYPLSNGGEIVAYSSDSSIQTNPSGAQSTFDTRITPAFVKTSRAGYIKYLVPEIPILFFGNSPSSNYNSIPISAGLNNLDSIKREQIKSMIKELESYSKSAQTIYTAINKDEESVEAGKTTKEEEYTDSELGKFYQKKRLLESQKIIWMSPGNSYPKLRHAFNQARHFKAML